MAESDILRLLLGPDGMRQRVVTGLHFPAEKFPDEGNIESNTLTHSTMDLVNSSRDSLCLSFCLFDSTLALLPGSVASSLEFEVESKAWAQGVFNPRELLWWSSLITADIVVNYPCLALVD